MKNFAIVILSVLAFLVSPSMVLYCLFAPLFEIKTHALVGALGIILFFASANACVHIDKVFPDKDK